MTYFFVQVSFLSGFLDFLIFELDRPTCDSTSSSFKVKSGLILADVLLERYVELQRQQTNQRKVRFFDLGRCLRSFSLQFITIVT